MKSLLFQGNTPLAQPATCAPCRNEVSVVFKKNGRLYTLVLRDKISVEDPYLTMVRAAAFAIRASEPYVMQPPPRAVRNFLINSNVVI
jgi:hypothetical protein